jgi:hypothetical protein
LHIGIDKHYHFWTDFWKDDVYNFWGEGDLSFLMCCTIKDTGLLGAWTTNPYRWWQHIPLKCREPVT